MPEPLRLTGIPASPGYAEGPLFDLDGVAGSYEPRPTAGEEKIALEAAISNTADRLAALIAASEGEAADMLEFQLAMLEDEALTGPAFAGIARGTAG